MTKDQAKAIPLPAILRCIGSHPVRESSKDLWYLAPWREERTASLHVHPGKNIWYDHGEDTGGDSIALIQRWLKFSREEATLPDALRWAANMIGGDHTPLLKKEAEANQDEEGWKLKRVKPLEYLALVRYLRSRGIPADIAKHYLSQVYVRSADNSKGLFALGFKNEEGGYELRNPFFKGCVVSKAISFIRAGDAHKPKQVHLFEGVMDLLTIAAVQPHWLKDGDAICLNSLSMLHSALPYLKGYGYEVLYSWMDNDRAGIKATELLKRFASSEPGLSHQPMNEVYQPHKDVNAWHMHTLNLSL